MYQAPAKIIVIDPFPATLPPFPHHIEKGRERERQKMRKYFRSRIIFKDRKKQSGFGAELLPFILVL